MTRISGLTLSVVLLTSLTGCGLGGEAETEALAPPAAPVASATPVEQAAESDEPTWAEMTDPTGLRFAFPSPVQPEKTTQPYPGGDPIDMRTYQTEVDDILVGVAVADGRDFTGYDGKAVFRGMVSRLSEQGVEDVALGRVRPLAVAPATGLRSTLTFTASDGTTKNYWRMATLTDGDVLVMLQVLTFAPTLSADTKAPVDDAFAQLTEGLTFP